MKRIKVLFTFLLVLALTLTLSFRKNQKSEWKGIYNRLAFADELETEETSNLSETKFNVSAGGSYVLLATAIKDTTLTYEVGYVIDGFEFNDNDTHETTKVYSSITFPGQDPVTAEDIFGEDYADCKMIVWELHYSYETELSVKAYYINGVLVNEVLTKDDSDEVIENALKGVVHVHEWNEGEVTTPATCVDGGVKTFTCACGETKTENITALGHDYQKVDAVAATHDAFGVAEHYECSRCHALALDVEGTQPTTLEELQIAKLVRITFNTDGGSTINPIDVEVGTKSAGLSSFTTTKEGYEFEGWYFNSVKLTGEEEVTEDLTVVANWLEIVNVTGVLKDLCLYQSDDQSFTLVDGHTTETVLSVKVGEKSINFTQNESNVALNQTDVKALSSGVQDLVIKTNKSIINTKVETFNIIVSNATELQELMDRLNGSKTDANGRYIFDADIDASSITLGSTALTFFGLVDGRGHIVSNLKVDNGAGIVKEISKQGTFKNIAFTNGVGKRVFLAYLCSGILENVYVDAQIPTSWNYYGVVGKLENGFNNGLLKNCVFNVKLVMNSGADLGYGGIMGALAIGGADIKDSYFINNGSTAGMKFIGATNGSAVNTSDFVNVYGYDKANDFIYNASFTSENGWASYFSANENGFYFNNTLVLEYVDELIDKDYDCYSKSVNTGVIDGDIISSKLDGTEVVVTYNNGVVQIPSASLSAGSTSILVIKTSTAKYSFKLNCYTIIASNAEELATLFETMNSADGKNGSYLLDADIDATGVTWTNSGRTFGGTLDGRGHIISNLSSTNGAGIVKELTGTIKNIAFLNGIGNRCFLVYQNSGVIENVYAQATVSTSWTWYGFVGTNRNDGTNSMMKNCVLNITLPNNEGAGGGVAGALYVGQGDFNNCYLINNGSTSGTLYIGTNSTDVNIATFTNVYGYDNVSDALADMEFNSTDGWKYFNISNDKLSFNGTVVLQ